MRYIEAQSCFELKPSEKSIFLAGGISDCPAWQREIVSLLTPTDLTILNPRGGNFPIDNPDAALPQMIWEHYALRIAKNILFWFPMETLCPIALYELGAWSKTDKPIYVGVHPDYSRRYDIEVQTALARPDVQIVDSLSALASQVIKRC